jgi:single-strand DNA-binding protein
MFNKIILAGNLTRDIELRYSQGGMGIAKTAIATSRKFTANGEKREEVMFVDITFFGRSAEIANQYLRKGSKVLVEGRLTFEQWVDQNGQKRSKHSVAVDSMQMLDSKGDNQSGGNTSMGNNNYSNDEDDSYGVPTQGRQQSYQPPVQQQKPQSYQEPKYNNSAASQSRQMPSSNSIPVIDIDEDEIPF